MSTNESNKKRIINYQEISRDSEELFEIMLEYMKLKNGNFEPIEAKILRQQAEDYILRDIPDYDSAILLMISALKIMQVYNELN
ncbi:MAG: hypothetical protein FK731_09140 [Asgard group archaeon]|nr:hypothetical protein [Asgard group archaeon]